MATPLKVNLTADVAATAISAGIQPGEEFSVWVQGTWGGGTLTISADEGDGTYTAIPSGTFTADGQKIFTNPSAVGGIKYALSGSTSPDLWLNVTPLRVQG